MARPEDRLQAAVARWWKRNRPPGWDMTAIEHGIAYHGDATSRARQWGKLKARGVKQGIEDMQFTGPARALVAIELKWGKNTQSEAQHDRQRHLVACGHTYVVCRSVEAVYEALASVVLFSPISREEALAEDRKLAQAPRVKASRGPRVVKRQVDRAGLAALALMETAIDAAAPLLTADVKRQKDSAYEERNRLVALIARLFPSGLKRTAIEGWSPAWHNCIYIDTPAGQLSWHFHDSHAHLFVGIPPYQGAWDGHSTDEKYQRIGALTRAYTPSQGTT